MSEGQPLKYKYKFSNEQPLVAKLDRTCRRSRFRRETIGSNETLSSGSSLKRLWDGYAVLWWRWLWMENVNDNSSGVSG